MDNHIQNIEQAIREKFENFNPAPPPEVWQGVLKGVAAQPKPSFISTYGKPIAAAATILLIAGLGLWWYLSDTPEQNTISTIPDIELVEEQTSGTDQSVSENNQKEINAPSTGSDETFSEVSDPSENENREAAILSETVKVPVEQSGGQKQSNQASPIQKDNVELADGHSKTMTETSESSSNDPYVKINSEITELPKQDIQLITTKGSICLAMNNPGRSSFIEKSPEATEIIFNESQKNTNDKWSSGIYLTTEFMLNDFDSVQLLPSYSLNYEPTYQFSNHFFLRFGLGLSYARDRGFAKVDYISNDVVGTYEDVYDITFDSIDGELVPTYYTKTREIWDSVQHLQVTEVTNKYLYLQTPVLFGYRKSEAKFNWYVYGGPAINVMINKQIEEPQDDLQDVDIIDLENNLPDRSPFFIQLWLGAGIEYKVGRKTAICLEPNYRYYFNTVYENEPYKSALSSFSLRFGVVFTMK